MRIVVAGLTSILGETVSRFLQEIGHEVVQVPDLDNPPAPHETPNLLILDQRSSYCDNGMGALSEARHRWGDPMVLMMLCRRAPTAEAAMRAGVFAYLSLPPRLSELELLVMRVAERLSTKTA